MINYYKVSIKGKNIYRFFNKILQEKINIFDVSLTKDMIIFKITYNDYIKLKKINTIYEINIIKVQGTKKYKNKLKFYKIFLIFFVINILLIIICSNMIFKIDINTSNEELKTIIKEELIKNKITIWSIKKSYNELEKIKSLIKQSNKDKIEWIEIEENGTTYKINVIERINKTKKEKYQKHDIIASKNGIIKDMFVTSGQVLKNPGDYVSKGEVLVSSKITKNDDIKNIVDSKGIIYAEVWYKVLLNSSLITKVQEYKNGTFFLNFKIFDKVIPILKINISNMKKEKYIDFFHNEIFSIIIKKEYNENLVPKKYSIEEITKKLEKKAKEEIEKTLDVNEKILLQKTLKITTNNDKIYVEVFFKVYEDIALRKITSKS